MRKFETGDGGLLVANEDQLAKERIVPAFVNEGKAKEIPGATFEFTSGQLVEGDIFEFGNRIFEFVSRDLAGNVNAVPIIVSSDGRNNRGPVENMQIKGKVQKVQRLK